MAGFLAAVLSLFGCGGKTSPHIILDGPGMVHDYRTEFAGTWTCASANRTLVFTNETLTIVEGTEILFECKWVFGFGEDNERCAMPFGEQMLGDYSRIVQKPIAPGDPDTARSVRLIAEQDGREDAYVFESEERTLHPVTADMPDGGWRCTCGVVNDSKFCTNCGTKRPD